ncbi:Bifunctional protein MdtA [Planctomycetes bacterium CA13]|uniref:Bifunctional protein MdtA n=1 Tax=Novipirellula herctigrandis TaxID=2527986 RepID=A0A5C5YN46_9BACT|nr:Bifunctional protein MdtA [Planctomycetes bacterium CA13]
MPSKILLQLDADDYASSFDAVVAYDAGVEHLLTYAGVHTECVTPLVHGAMFTRGGDKLRHTAIFVGGSNVDQAEAILRQVQSCFFGPVRVSVMLDANGCNTTAAAAVVNAAREVELRGTKAVVLGATGPVGRRVTQLLAHDGANVIATSRSLEKATRACEHIRGTSPSGTVEPACTKDGNAMGRILDGASILIACGAAGVQLIDKETLRKCQSLKVAIDLNAVPPTGIEGIEVTNRATKLGDVVTYGAIGVGSLKMKTHKAAIKSLFETNDRVLDFAEIYQIAQSVAT